MPKAPWSYRLETPDATSAGIEGYVVWVDGQPDSAGTVSALLDRAGSRFVVVELGSPPLSSDLRAIPLEDVREVDHDALAVRIRPAELAEALELDPELAVRDGTAEASRVAVPPEELLPEPQAPGVGGPTDRPTILVAIGSMLVAAFATLAVLALTYAASSAWLLLLLAVPAAIALVGAGLAYRAYREPYARSAGHAARARRMR
jgi:hypothetical protein